MKKLLSWNVNGIRAVAKKGFTDWLANSGADLVSLQETKVSPDTLLGEELLRPTGYTTYWDYATEKKGYSGVACFCRDTFLPQRVTTKFTAPVLSHEGRLLQLDYPEFIFFNVYFPNGGASPERLRYKLKFYEAFLDYLNQLKKSGQKNIIFCGDVNTAHREIDLARPKENINHSGFMPIERAWLDKFVATGFVDTFRLFNQGGGEYSWWDQKTYARERNVGWRIDYFYVSEGLVSKVKDAFILADVMGSDHAPVGITLDL